MSIGNILNDFGQINVPILTNDLVTNKLYNLNNVLQLELTNTGPKFYSDLDLNNFNILNAQSFNVNQFTTDELITDIIKDSSLNLVATIQPSSVLFNRDIDMGGNDILNVATFGVVDFTATNTITTNIKSADLTTNFEILTAGPKLMKNLNANNNNINNINIGTLTTTKSTNLHATDIYEYNGINKVISLSLTGAKLENNLDVNNKNLNNLANIYNITQSNNLLNLKFDKAGGSLSGNLNLSNNDITNINNTTSTNLNATTLKSISGVNNIVLQNTGALLSADLDVNNKVLNNLNNIYTKTETNNLLNNKLNLSGGTLSGNLNMNNNQITNINDVFSNDINTSNIYDITGVNKALTFSNFGAKLEKDLDCNAKNLNNVGSMVVTNTLFINSIELYNLYDGLGNGPLITFAGNSIYNSPINMNFYNIFNCNELTSTSIQTTNIKTALGVNSLTLGASGVTLENNILGNLKNISNVNNITAQNLTLTTPLGLASGGVGFNNIAVGDILYSGVANTINKLNIGANNKILMSNGTTPYYGDVNINNTVGVLSVDKGGTSFSSFVSGDMIIANGVTSLTRFPAVAFGSVLLSNGIGASPIYSKIDLTQHINSSLLPFSNAGLGFNTAIIGDIIYANANNSIGKLPVGSVSGSVLTSNGTGVVPSYQVLDLANTSGSLSASRGGTGISTYTAGDILVASGVSTLSKITAVGTGNVLLSGGVGVSPLYGKVGLTTHVNGVLDILNGGLGLSTIAQGEILFGSNTNIIGKLAKAVAGNVLLSDGIIPTYGKVNLTQHIAGVLPIANGGTNNTSYINGQLLIGDTVTGGLIKNTLTGTTDQIIINNSSGNITLSTPQNINTNSNVIFNDLNLNGRITTSYGTENNPAYKWVDGAFPNLDTGFYYENPRKINVSCGGVKNFVMSNLGLDVTSGYIKNNGGFIESTSYNKSSKNICNSGTSALPSFCFAGEENTGLYLSSAGNLSISNLGTLNTTFGTTFNTVNQPIREASGSAVAPSYSFQSDTDTGLYYNSVNSRLSVAHTGAEVASFNATKLLLGNSVGLCYNQTGANQWCGTATLNNGVVTVSTNKITANSIVLITIKTISPAGNLGVQYIVTARTVGVNFTIQSTQRNRTLEAADDSVLNWLIIDIN